MDGMGHTRWWYGINDPVHPLNRSAHACLSHGRYLYILNGYTSMDNEMCLFDRVGLTRLDPLTHTLQFIPVHWQCASMRQHGCSPPFLNTSGVAAASSTTSNCLYAFGGFSLLEGFHTNILIRYQLPTDSHVTQTLEHPHRGFIRLQPPCAQTSVISGHGLLSYLLSFSHASWALPSLLYTVLRGLQRRIRDDRSDGLSPRIASVNNAFPSPRDKLSMEHWNGELYVFGGYGPGMHPPTYWPQHLIQWPFLFDPDTWNRNKKNPEWISCEPERGWNNQLLIFNLTLERWKLCTDALGNAPSPRAAHQSVIYPKRNWMLLFGGRGPTVTQRSRDGLNRYETYEAGRLNDLYCLNLRLCEWTRVRTPLDAPNPETAPIWPCGRSWMGIASMGEDSDMGGATGCAFDQQATTSSNPKSADLFICGGFSNANHALGDAYRVRVHRCGDHEQLEATVLSDSMGTQSECIRPQLVRNTQLINGFTCQEEPLCDDGTSAILNVQRMSSDDWSVTDDQPVSAWPCPSQSEFADEDMAHCRLFYAQLIFDSPAMAVRPQSPRPTQAFFHVSRAHAELIVFILCHFSTFNMCSHAGKESSSRIPTSTNYLSSEIDQTCTQILADAPPIVLIAAFFVRVFTRFMLPWEPVLMLLREPDQWLPADSQHQLIKQLTSDKALESTIGGDPLHLSLSTRAVLEKLAILFPVDKIRTPAPFWHHALNGHGQLSYHIQQTVLSFLLWTGHAPLTRKCTDWHTLPIGEFHSPPQPASHLLDQLPSRRFWHTSTCALDGTVYVIGGSTEDRVTGMLECYTSVKPDKLGSICLRLLCQHIISHHHFDRVQKTLPSQALQSVGRRGGQNCHDTQSTCICEPCMQLWSLVNQPVMDQLTRWLS